MATTVIDQTLRESLNANHIFSAFEHICENNKDLSKHLTFSVVGVDSSNPIFKIALKKSKHKVPRIFEKGMRTIRVKPSRKEAKHRLDSLEDSLVLGENQKYVEIVGPVVERIRNRLIKNGEASFYFHNGKPYLAKQHLDGSYRPKFAHDNNAFLGFVKKKKRKPKGKQVESELVPDLTPDSSPGTDDNLPQETSFDEIADKTPDKEAADKKFEKDVDEVIDDIVSKIPPKEKTYTETSAAEEKRKKEKIC